MRFHVVRPRPIVAFVTDLDTRAILAPNAASGPDHRQCFAFEGSPPQSCRRAPRPEPMQQAVILRPAVDDKGRRMRNHAKFLVVDHQILVVTGANLSLSAEERNVELGLRIDDPLLARAVEDQMRALEDVGIYERVGGKG